MHFLRGRKFETFRGRTMDRPWACVTVCVRWEDRIPTLVVEEGSVGVLKGGVLLAEVPREVRVVGPEGKIIRPSGKFYVTVETFDPYHALTDSPEF